MVLDNQVSLSLPAASLRYPAALVGSGDREIVIRPLALSDAPSIAEAIATSLPELKAFMPWAHVPQTVDAQRHRIVKAIYDYWTGCDFTLGVYGWPSGVVVGGTGLHARTLSHQGLEIGYWISTPYTGSGVATQVARCLIVYGFSYLGLDRVQCGHDAENTASARVNDKCGFRTEGRLRNFAGKPTPALIENGWRGSGEIVMRGLCPPDVSGLSWYHEAREKLVVYDWLGRIVRGPPDQ